MAKMDWKNSDVVKAEDMNQIGQEINQLHTELKDRLDIANTDPVTLQPGVQVVHAAKDARFRLGEMKGRTLINLCSIGSMDSLSGWGYDPDSVTVDTTEKVQGSGSAKVTIKNGSYVDVFSIHQYDKTQRYVVVGNVKTYGGAKARVRMVELMGIEYSSPEVSSDGGFTTIFSRVPDGAFSSNKAIYCGIVFVGPNGSGGYMDAVRVYAVSQAEYDALGTMTAEQVDTKYPFVPSGIVGVENPYVVGTSDNLLPPFYEWEQGYNIVGTDRISISSPYDAEINASVGGTYLRYYAKPTAGTYTLNVSKTGNNARAYMYLCKQDKTRLTGTQLFGSITTTEEAPIIEVVFNTLGDNGTMPGVATFSKPSLTLGTVPKPFLPQRKSMLAFQTELHANPTDGNDPDVLFERDGQYFKLEKWKKVVLDGSLNWGFLDGYNGAKRVTVSTSFAIAGTNNGFVTKYNGKPLVTNINTYDTPDSFGITASSLLLNVPNKDSGWGPDYSPTQDEIKAYFMGWKMYDNRNGWDGEPYNVTDGSGDYKAWVKINSKDSSNVTSTLPTYSYSEWTPYNLLYRLAKETLDPVVSEGCLTLAEGVNSVEICTGIVLRERARLGNFPSIGGYWYIAVDGAKLPGGASETKYKTDRILSVYRDNRPDNSWTIDNNGSASNAYGNARAYKLGNDTDIGFLYSVTYTKLDKSPIQPITGTLAANEKAQISDLTAGVAEALHRVSVVEQKKADEDTPSLAWITPTLLNGATPYGPYTPQYMKKDGRVYLRGEAVLTALSVPVFRLPEGYRPNRRPRFIGYSFSNQVVPGEIIVTETGEVTILSGGLSAVSFDGVSFLAK